LITPRTKRRIKNLLSGERSAVWVGKSGISQQVLAEIDGHLERAEMVKVKILKAALGQQSAMVIAQEIARQTESALVEVRGHTFILFRKERKERKAQ